MALGVMEKVKERFSLLAALAVSTSGFSEPLVSFFFFPLPLGKVLLFVTVPLLFPCEPSLGSG